MSAKSTYTFRARDAFGTVVSGSLEADSAEEISRRLRADGMFVLSVEDRPMRAAAELDAEQIRLNEVARAVRREDVIAFCRQLSVMLDTGVPIAEAMQVFVDQAPRREFRIVLEALCDDLHSGVPLSAAMAKWPRAFPNMMLSLVKASEASGTMALMLGRIATYLTKERRTARQIRGALGYPLFMMSAGLLMTIFLMTFVLPKFATIYEQRAARLPAPTQILLAISEFLTTQYLFYGPGLLVGGMLFMVWMRHRSSKRVRDWLRLHVPLIRHMYHQLYITRSMRTMATLLSAGVSLLDIIEICRGVTSNVYYDKLWSDMERGVREGQRINDVLKDSHLIPSNVASMIASGEKSGRLSEVTERVAEFAEEELDMAVKSVTSYIEPIMIICMGFVIGGIAIALLLPVFSMGNVVSGNG